jgi:tRNA-splicing ligase RtcB
MKDKLKRLNEYEWFLPTSARKEMRVGGKLIASEKIHSAIEDGAMEQLSNVCCLPGAIEPVCALPDAHFGF